MVITAPCREATMPPIIQDDISLSTFSVDEHKRLFSEVRRCTVHFDDTATVVHKIERIRDKRCKELWYTRDEYAEIKLSNRRDVHSVKDGCMDTSEICTLLRGLERLFTKGRRDRQKMAINAVLHEQHRQAAINLNAPLIIAVEYALASNKSRDESRARGLWDANEVTDDYLFGKEQPASLEALGNSCLTKASDAASRRKKKRTGRSSGKIRQGRSSGQIRQLKDTISANH
jgi:hypothetical protein